MLRLISAIVCLSLLLLFSSPSEKEISDSALKITSQFQEGDVILIHSNDFFSHFVRSVDKCKQSSFKLVVNEGREIKLLVSDADNIADNTQGLRLVNPIHYLNSYDSLSIKHLRPLKMTEAAKKQIQKYIERSKNEVVSYDFSYFKNSQDKLTCEKVINTVHEGSFSMINHDRPWFWAFLPCDFDESKFEALSDWTQFFVVK